MPSKMHYAWSSMQPSARCCSQSVAVLSSGMSCWLLRTNGHTVHRLYTCHIRWSLSTEMSSWHVPGIYIHTHSFNGPFSGTTRVSRYQKRKTNLDFTGARDSEWQWHQLGHMQVCISVQTDNHAITPPLMFFTGRMPFLPPSQQRHSTEGTGIPTVIVGFVKSWCQICILTFVFKKMSTSKKQRRNAGD